ncbi:hypothetical protein J4417_01975 [Candidatus Woesearchaeota archaeon]|nr:hypothetical protein [Candidatus Woesearchaeota archaeon]
MADDLVQRQTAVKLLITDLLSGEFSKEESQTPVLSLGEQKIYRVNVIGMVIGKAEEEVLANLFLNDGTASINLRFFERNSALDELNAGDAVMVVGRLRDYNGERYLSPEIVKKVDRLWLQHRRKELGAETRQINAAVKEEPAGKIMPKQEPVEEESKDESSEFLSPEGKILKNIADLDKGEGAEIEEVLAASKVNYAEEIIKRMLERGELFQIMPGRVKVV